MRMAIPLHLERESSVFSEEQLNYCTPGAKGSISKLDL